jgi:hypothetical protein
MRRIKLYRGRKERKKEIKDKIKRVKEREIIIRFRRGL